MVYIKKHTPSMEPKIIRKLNPCNIPYLTQELRCTDGCAIVMNNGSVSDASDNFLKTISTAFNLHCPLTTIHSRPKTAVAKKKRNVITHWYTPSWKSLKNVL